MNCVRCNKETNNPKFCCRSCAASYNNEQYPKRQKDASKLVACLHCKNLFTYNVHKNRKYCSLKCANAHRAFIIETQGFGNGHSHNNSIRRYLKAKHGNKCMICGQSGEDWNGKPITLIVDHIDGKSNNNTIENLRIVCPNCDCQLPTYKAKNKGNSSRSYYIVQK